MSVEPTEKYYEKLSEELAKIVKEVKDTPVDEGHRSEIRRSKSAIGKEPLTFALYFGVKRMLTHNENTYRTIFGFLSDGLIRD